MRYHATVAERAFAVELGADGVRVDGRRLEVDLVHVEGSAVLSLLVDGASHRLVAHRTGPGRWQIEVRAVRYRVEAVDQRTRAVREMAGTRASAVGPSPVRAPMPGLIVKVEVVEGDIVEAGQGIIVVEAMKMENELRAEGPAVVRRIHVTQGDTVDRDQLLVELDAPQEATEPAGSAEPAGAG